MVEDFLDGATPDLPTRIEIGLLDFHNDQVLFFHAENSQFFRFQCNELAAYLFVCVWFSHLHQIKAGAGEILQF